MERVILEDQEQGFNGNTLEWRGRKLKELSDKELIDVIVHFFELNLALQAELETTKHVIS